MALDFNLLRPTGGPNPVNAFLQGQQGAMDRDLAQQKMAQDQEMNALRRQQLTGQIQTQEETRVKNRAAEKTGMFRERLLRAPNAEAARSIVQMQYADPDLAPILSQASTLEQALAEIPDDPQQLRTYLEQEAVGMGKWIESQRPKLTPTGDVYDPATREFIRRPQAAPAPVKQPQPVEEYLFARSPEGGGFTGSYQDFLAAKRAPAAQGAGGGTRAPAMPKAPAGYRYTPTGDLEAIPGGPAAAGPNLTPKDIQKREAALPQARQAVSTVSNTMSIIGETVDRLLANRDGLNGVTGLVGGRTPGITDAARQAEADINQLKNLAFIQGITELRNASKNGAGVGNVSNKEGDRFENLKASLERTQSYNSMIDALKRLKSQSEFTRQSLKEAFDETYSYRDNAATAAPPTSGRPEGVGADWTLMTDKNNNRAWVSPDRKSFKEVK
jgi:hypothetical protein